MRNFRRRIVMFVAFVLVLSAGLTVVPAAAQNPITPARDAFRKAQEEAKRKQEEEQKRKQQPPPQPAQPQQPATAQAPPAAASPPPASTQGGTSQVVTLGDLDKSAAPAAPLDPKKMPDILGVHLGTPVQEAVDILKGQYPRAPIQPWMDNPLPLSIPQKQWTYAVTFNRGNPGYQDDINVNVTEPPNTQAVWSVRRFSIMQHVNRGTLLGALREKYGKETVATNSGGSIAANERQIQDMWWLFDEQGRRVPMPGSGISTLFNCPTVPAEGSTMEGAANNADPWCASSYVAVRVNLVSDPDIITAIRYELIDLPLARRAFKATNDWRQAELEKLRQQQIEQSKQNRPKL